MKLIYLSTIILPSPLANRLQTMKMAEAFSKLCDFKLYVGEKRSSDKEIFNYYGIWHPFEITELGIPKLKPRSFFSFSRYSKIIREEKPDVIYIREPHLDFFLSFFSKNLFFEAHTILQPFFSYFFLKRLRGIVVTSQKIKEFFIEHGLNKDKILVAPNGVDLKEFDISQTKEECRKRLNLPLDKKIILYTGHLYSWKGVDILAQASKYLPEDVKIYFVGGTEKEIEKFKIQNRLSEGQAAKFKIRVVGHRPHSEPPFWLKAADVLVLPDSIKEEPLKFGASPIKMFEYMASKRPIVASDLPSIREILNDSSTSSGQGNAVLAKPDDPEDLAKGIKKIIEGKNLAEKISNRAFQDVQNYTWQKRAKNILKFINSKL